MAKAFISEQQLEQLIQQSTVDLTEAMKYFPEAARNIQVKQATEAVKSGDKGKLQDLKNQYPSPEMQNLVSALQNRQYVQRLVQEVIPLIKQIDNKREKGETLSPRETNLLAQKSAWVDWAKSRYPQAFKASEQTNANNLQAANKLEKREEATVTGNLKNPAVKSEDETITYANTSKLTTAETSQTQKPQSTINVSLSEEKPLSPEEMKNANNSQAANKLEKREQVTVTGNLKNPAVKSEDETITYVNTSKLATAETSQTQKPQSTINVSLSEEKPLSPEEMKAEVQKGNEIHSALKAGITEPDKQQADLADVKDAFNIKTSDGSGGYFDKAPVNKDDFKTIDSSKIFEKGLGRLEKIGAGKNPDELMFQVMEFALLAPIDMATEWLNQIRSNMKENEKIRQSKRYEFIDTNLRNNGLSMPKLAAILAHDTQEWLLNDPAYTKIPLNGPYSKYEQALKEKRDFAAGLPKNEQGAIDFNKMTRAQKKRYTTYMTHYAQVPPFKNVAYEATGLALMGKELKEMASQAAKMQTIQVAQHQQQVPQGQQAQPTAKEQQTQGQPTPQPTIQVSPQGQQAQPAPQPTAKEQQTQTPAQTQSTPQPTIQVSPQAQQAQPTPQPTAKEQQTQAQTQPTPQPTIQVSPQAQQAQPVPQPTAKAPQAPQTSEQAKLRDEALQSVKLDPLEKVTVTGNLKSPVIITPNGKVTADASNATELTVKVTQLRAKKEKNDADKNNVMQQQRLLSNTRTGNSGRGQTTTITYTQSQGRTN